MNLWDGRTAAPYHSNSNITSCSNSVGKASGQHAISLSKNTIRVQSSDCCGRKRKHCPANNALRVVPGNIFGTASERDVASQFM
jgi:hypothetical protein